MWGRNLQNFSFCYSESNLSLDFIICLSPQFWTNDSQYKPPLLTKVFSILEICAQVNKICNHMFEVITSREILLRGKNPCMDLDSVGTHISMYFPLCTQNHLGSTNFSSKTLIYMKWQRKWVCEKMNEHLPTYPLYYFFQFRLTKHAGP